MAQQVVVMYAGRVVETGPTAEILRHPQHPYTQGLLASRPLPGERRRRLYSIPGQVPDLAALPPGCAFADRCERANADCRQSLPAAGNNAAGRLLSHPIRGAGCMNTENNEYVIEVEGLKNTFRCATGSLASKPGNCGRWTASAFAFARGPFSAWWANPAAGKPPWAARCSDCMRKPPVA
jgi:oligopeptide/dipeptide ABC transporter ATP-binding protein